MLRIRDMAVRDMTETTFFERTGCFAERKFFRDFCFHHCSLCKNILLEFFRKIGPQIQFDEYLNVVHMFVERVISFYFFSKKCYNLF